MVVVQVNPSHEVASIHWCRWPRHFTAYSRWIGHLIGGITWNVGELLQTTEIHCHKPVSLDNTPHRPEVENFIKSNFYKSMQSRSSSFVLPRILDYFQFLDSPITNINASDGYQASVAVQNFLKTQTSTTPEYWHNIRRLVLYHTVLGCQLSRSSSPNVGQQRVHQT
jgi:hypothetical protein